LTFLFMKKILENTIISLTSYPGRINTVHLAIKSLLNQTVKTEKCILWLAEEEFPAGEKGLPKVLLDLTNAGLSIEWCNNLKSYKKLIPALMKYPEKIIITFDDDTIYNKRAVESLYECHCKYPNDIIAHRVYRKYFDGNNNLVIFPGQIYYDNKSAMYRNFNAIKEASFFNRLGSGGGTLFPPGSLHSEALNEQKFLSLIPTNDDIWFWLQGVHKKTKVRVPDIHFHNLQSIPNSQETGLTHINTKNVFYQQLNNILNAYPVILKILQSENNQNMETINKIINDNEHPLISVVCFSRNHESFIRKCLDGILNQKIMVPFEIIIYDDASTDQTVNIIREYEKLYSKKIRVVCQEKKIFSNDAQLPPISFFEKLNGEYIAFCNGNDYWADSYKLYKQFDFIKGKLDYSLVSSGFTENNTGTITDKTIKCGDSMGFEYTSLEIRKAPHWQLSTILCRKNALDKFKRKYSRFKIRNDIHLIYFLLKSGIGWYFPENFVVHNIQKNTENEIITQYTGLKELYKKTKDVSLSKLYYRNIELMLRNALYKNKTEKSKLWIDLHTKDLPTIGIAIKKLTKKLFSKISL